MHMEGIDFVALFEGAVVVAFVSDEVQGVFHLAPHEVQKTILFIMFFYAVS